MKPSKKREAAEKELDQRIKSLELQEKATAAENEYQDSHYRPVMILATAFLCLAIAAAGVVVTMTVYKDRSEASAVSHNESTELPAVSYSVESFSTDPIYNSGTYSQIDAVDDVQIITASPAETNASSITEASSVSNEPQNEPQSDDTGASSTTAVRPASGTAVSVAERGYNGNVLFG